MKSKNYSTVTELTAKIKDLLENNFFNVFVRGEISNFIHHGSGHMYFTLKDRNSEIKSVMFRGSNQNLNFQPADGVEVFLQGKINKAVTVKGLRVSAGARAAIEAAGGKVKD